MSRAKRARSLPVIPVPAPPAIQPKTRRLLPFWLIVTASVLIVVGGITALITLGVTVWGPQQYVANMREMTHEVGIVNDRTSPLVIANSINSQQSIDGAIILFAGSITSQTQDVIKMGYKAPNGDSYILSVPLKRITFHQEVGVKPTGKFHFNNWSVGDTLQDNIDMPFSDDLAGRNDMHITVNLTPEQFQKLVQG